MITYSPDRKYGTADSISRIELSEKANNVYGKQDIHSSDRKALHIGKQMEFSSRQADPVSRAFHLASRAREKFVPRSPFTALRRDVTASIRAFQ